MKIYRKLYVAAVNVKHFLTTSYNFNTENFKALGNLVHKEEKEIFYTDSYQVTTDEKYMVDCVKGGRGLMGDPPEIYKEDVKRVQR